MTFSFFFDSLTRAKLLIKRKERTIWHLFSALPFVLSGGAVLVSPLRIGIKKIKTWNLFSR